MFTIIPEFIPAEKGNVKLAAFDLDSTLIVSDRATPFDKSPKHWIFMGDMPEFISRFVNDWIVCIFTNQSKFDEEMKLKLYQIRDKFISLNNWTPFFMVAIKENRKPERGLYDMFISIIKEKGYTVDSGFYCGDACGKDDPFPPYQWSDSDRIFASNIGLYFYRPMDLLGSRTVIPSETQELVVLMGNQGSGKTTTALYLEQCGYIHASLDILKTVPKMIKLIKSSLSMGKSVVVDATNTSEEKRRVYLYLFEGKKRIVWHIRDGRVFNGLREKKVPEVAYRVYSKNFERPSGIVDLVY